ncbi:uncharacterized protein [Procambarus clarkii]|uniref:uncharacterized protein isoform X2 n=1 Tax=Procambarus clarkii TaxID=6728 RepID=UPI0037432887
MASGSAPQHLPPQHPGGPQLHPHNTGGPQLHPHNTGGQQLNPHHTRGHQLDPHHTRGHQLDPHHTRGHQLDPHHTRGHQLDPHHTRGHQLDSHHTRGHQLDPHLHSGIVGGCGSVGSSGAEGCGSVGSSGAEGCGSVASSGAGGCGSVGASGAGGCGRCGQALSIFFNKRVRCGGGCQLAACGKCAPWNTAAGAHVCAVCAAAAAHQVWPQEAPTPTVDHAASVEVKRLSEQAKWDLLLYYYCYCYGEQELPPPPPAAAAAGPAPPPAPAAAPAGDPVGPPAPVGPAPAPAAGTVPSPIGGACETWEVVRSSAGPGATPAPTPALHHAMILPCQMERYDPASTRHTPGYDPASTRHTPGYDPAISPETPVEDFNSHTYEDILATAILNKVLETCEEGRPDEVTIEVSHDVASTDTDSGMSGGVKESRRGRHKRGEVSEGGSEGSEERSLTPLHHPAHRPPTVSPDQGVVTDDCWGNAVTGDGAPLQFKIEEHVEEITTHHLTDDDQDLEGIYDEEISDSGGSWRGSRCSLDDSRETRRHKVSHHSVTEDPLLSTINAVLPDPAQISSRRASFPELGADIIQDSCLDVECCEVGPCDMVLDSDTWEENWLFRRQRLTGASVVDPVTMLIPNPEAHVPATVGNRDVDELSELSDQQSIGSGEPWSLSESDGEVDGGDSYQPSTASRELSTLAGEIVAEFAQQDQEYTVDYSVPSRVTAAATGAHSNKHLASPYSLPTSSQKSPEAQHLTRFLYANQEEVLRNYHDGKAVQGIRNPGITEKSHIDSDFVFEGERPVPKPRKLSLATTHASKIPAKSPVQLLLSSVEDLTILSPPLEIPHPKNASSKSESVWFVETPEDSVIMQGRTLRLSCQVNAKKPMGVSWYHNGSLVPVGGCDQWAYRRGPSHHLHVYDMKAAAAGVYAAAAYTATNCVWAFCRVQHKANSRPPKRPTFTKGLVDMTVEEGGEVNVQCQVQGHPEPRVIFSRDSRTLEPSSRLAIQSDQYGTWMLRLIECTASDSGEITATAVNAMSTVITQCRIRVVPEGTPISHQDHTDSGRLHSSLQTDKQQDPRPGGRHICKKHNPGSHSPNSLPSSSDNLLTSAKTPAASHQGNLTKSSGVNTDAGDVDDVQQVPTRPGIPVKDMCICTYLSSINNEHVINDNKVTTEGNTDISGACTCRVHAMNDLSQTLDYCGILDNSTAGKVNNDALAAFSINEFANLDNLQEKFSNSSSPLLMESHNLTLTRIISSSSSPLGAVDLSLDYNPSSYGDVGSSSEKERLPLEELSGLTYPSSSAPVVENLKTNVELLVSRNASFPMITDPPHAFSILKNHHHKHEETRECDKPASSFASFSLTADPPHAFSILKNHHHKDKETRECDKPASSFASFSLTADPPHALSILKNHHHEHEETRECDKPASSYLAPPPTLPGTIAEREHRKWEAAVSLPNNPYAPERLVQRLSHAHAPERNPPLRRALSVEFPEEGGKELDPSLRDGVPPKPDLNRYSRDYYVTTTSGKTSSLNFRHQKCQQQAQQQQDNQLQKGRQQKLYKSEIMLSANGHQARTPTSLDHSTYVEDPIHIIDGGLQKANKSSSEATLHQLRSLEVESSHPSDWKNELRDIQAARVEREVARFQRTIDETQRRWEENYARHIPRSVHANAQSDSSTEVLHNPRVDVYLVPRRHDLWRTVSEDTIAAQPRERPFLQPFLRHTSADNLQPMAKVSNLHNLESAPQHSSRSMNSMSSMSNVNINSLTGLGKRGNYLHHSKFGRSVESVSTYSDGESHGEGMESDVSTRTLDDVPALPSVRKLASKFDLASQERVNDLDKRGRDNILAEKWSPGDQVHRRNLTNNLNKQTEKPYVVKEVRSLPSGEDSHPATETDMFNSDVDSTEFDDEATVTSVSLPPTPGSLSDKRSLSTPSLIDTDSCFSVDSRDSNMTASYNQFSDRTIFGVTLRRTSINSSDSYSSRKQTSLSSFSSAEELQGAGFEQVSHKSRHSWSTSKGHLETKVIQYDNDPDAPKMLRQSSVTKTHHGSMFDLSYKESDKLRHQKQFHSSLDLSSVSKSAEVKTRVELAQVNTRDAKNPTKIQGMNKQVGMPNVSILSGSAFAPKGKRTMSDFLNSYTGHKSLLDLKRIEEKTEDDTDGRRSRDARKQQRYSDHPKDSFNKKDTFKISKCEGSLQSTDRVAVGSMGQQDNNGDRVRHKQTNINIPSVNNLSPQPLLCTDLENAENIEQTSRNDQIAIPVSFSPVVVDDSETKKLSDDPSDKISHISDITDDDSSSHTSDGTNTGTLTNFTEDDQFMIELNEASVSAFQCQVTKDIPAPTESNDKLPSVSNSPIMLNKGSEKKPIISTTSVNSLQKHRSIGDLLREYTNISSLDEKSAFSKTTISSNVATESNKTIITISDNEMNLQTQAPKVVKSIASAHNAVVCPTTASAHNVAVSPTTVSVHNIAVSSTKANAHNVAGFPIKLSTDLNKGNMNVKSYNREEATGDLGDQIQTLKNKYPEENCPNTTNECTVITLSGEEAPLSDPAIAVYHASIVYVGDNVKESHIEDSALSSASGKTSSVSEDVNGSVSVLSTHTKLPPSEDNVDSITISHSRTEKKPVPQSPQSAYLGKSSVNVDTIISSSLAEVQDNDVHINIKKDDLSTTGSHVTIISVSKAADSFSPSQKSNVISSSAENSSDDEILFDDPVALTRLIVHNSRVGNSNKFKPRKKLDIRNASVPVNSPFSPIRSKSNIGKLEFERGITEDSQPNKLGLRDSYDEGVHSQLSDMEMTPSTTSTKSKSTSSLDIACEGHEPMVECN